MSDIKFFFLLKKQKQLTFDGHAHSVVSPFGSFHFISPDRPDTTLCGKYKEILKTEGGTRKHSEEKVRPEGVPPCKECVEAWKARKDSAWSKWVERTTNV